MPARASNAGAPAGTRKAEKRVRYSRELRLITAFSLALVGMIWSTVYVLVHKGRQDAIEDAYRDSYTSAAVFAEQATRTFRLLDSVMQLVAYEVGKAPSANRLRELVDENFVTMDTLVLLSFIDSSGITQGSNLGPDPLHTNLSDREHIRVHLDNKVQGLYIGKPVLGRVSGKWSIQLTRRIEAQDGRMVGVLVASVDPHYFERFWRGLAGARQDVTELIGLDGVLRARSTNVEAALAANVNRSAIARLAADTAVGRFASTEADGRERLTNYVRLEELPLVVTAGVASDAVLADTWEATKIYLIIGLGTTVIVALFGVMLGHLAWRLHFSTLQAQNAERRLFEAIEAVPEGFALFDADDRLVVFNEAYRRLYSTSSEKIAIGSTFEDLLRFGVENGQYHSARGHEDEWLRARLEQHREPSGPLEQITDSGRWLRVEEKKTADGGIVGIRADITELKQRQFELARQTTLLQSTLQHMGEGIAVYDKDRKLIAWNKLCNDLLELPEWLIGSETTFDEVLRYQARRGDFGDADIETEVAQRVGDFQSGENGVSERRRRDGRTIEVRRSAMPGGGGILLYRDMTERKDYETRINLALRDAQSASRAKSEFLALISHEIRTPMNAIIGMSGLLAESDLEPTHKRYATAIEDAGERLLVIINDLLDFSRLEAGRLTLEKTPFDIREIVESAIEIAKALPNAAHLSIASEIEAGLPAVLLGDSGRINQILLNLLGNAVKFTPAGSINVAIRIVARIGGSCTLRCTVADTGPGISPGLRDRLFEPFEQGEATDDKHHGGTGLGLAICRKLVLLMGGAIGVENQSGAGSAFWFEVPCGIGTASSNPLITAREAPAASRRLRILVAEDVPANQVVVRSMLDALGHRAHIVGDGAEAIQAACEGEFDAILMDIQMPVLNGHDAIRQIRALGGRHAATPIIALTAFAQKSDMEAALASGATGFLTKPIRKRDLAVALEAYALPGASMLQTMERATFNREALREMESDIGRESFIQLLGKCIENIDARMSRLDGTLASADQKATRATAHQLRGLFGQFGAVRAAEAAHAVEAGPEGDLAGLVAALRTCAVDAVQTLDQVRNAA
jgi:signal transduction histidine kinase/DNA-binding NarL/FixJ family response regulator